MVWVVDLCDLFCYLVEYLVVVDFLEGFVVEVFVCVLVDE